MNWVGGKLIHLGDCIEVLKSLPENSVDAIVTDPPAGISFMNKDWDNAKGGREQWISWMADAMRECLRVLKPGAHGLVWAIPRTSHWTGTALEMAGFEVRDVVTHLFGSGFPKSLDISKAIDKAAGAEREIVSSVRKTQSYGRDTATGYGGDVDRNGVLNLTAPSTPEAKQWQGFGTALKPACEFWFLVRKPLSEKTVAANVLKWGTGGINIDAGRIGTKQMGGQKVKSSYSGTDGHFGGGKDRDKEFTATTATGRFPANLVLDEDAAAMLDAQSGVLGKSTGGSSGARSNGEDGYKFGSANKEVTKGCGFGDTGGASRFFYCAKSSKREKNAGLEGIEIIEISLGESWELGDLKATLQVDTEQCPPKVIDAFGTWDKSVSEWNTLLFGKSISDQLLENYKSTTKTKSNSTIESKTLNWLARSFTNESILDANLLRVFGGNLVQLAQSLKTSRNTTSVQMAYATNVKSVFANGQVEIKSVGTLKSSHPTVKPIRLMEYLIKLITPPNGTILDPFMGSGSTGVAAKRLGFQFTGIERENDYFEIAKRRIEEEPK